MASATTTCLAFLLLASNYILEMYRCWGDPAAMIFVAASYTCLVLLFHFLRKLEMESPDSAERHQARIGVRVTTTLLMAMFSWGGRPCRHAAATCFEFMGSTLATIFSWQVAAAMIFLLASYLSLILLLYCLRRFFETAARASSTRLKTKLRTPILSWEVAALLPTPVVSAVVLLMATSTVAGGFYALFLLSMRA
ncbi:unnamed protein product [Urochloa humidicola]